MIGPEGEEGRAGFVELRYPGMNNDRRSEGLHKIGYDCMVQEA